MPKLLPIMAIATSLYAKPFILDTESNVSFECLYNDTAISITTTFTDRDSNVWIGTGDGRVLVNSGSMVLPVFTHSQFSTPIRTIAQSPNGTIWFGGKTLYKVDSEGCVSALDPYYWAHDGVYRQQLNWIADIYPESDSVLWLAGEGIGAMKYTVPTGEVQPYFAASGSMTYYAMTLAHGESDGTVLFGGRTGVEYGIFTPDTVSKKLVKQIPLDSMDYQSDVVLSLGKRNNLWWITTTRGLWFADSLSGTPRFAASSELISLLLADDKKSVVELSDHFDQTSHLKEPLSRAIPMSCRYSSQEIRFSESITGTVSVVDLKGRVVSEQELTNQNSVALTVSPAAGVYIIRLTTPNRAVYQFLTAIR